MFTLGTSFDYANSFKPELINFLRNDLRKEAAESQDFRDLFDQLDMVEKLLKQINKDFTKINEKYKLLFGLRDYHNLFNDKDFKKEIMLYIKYKANQA